MGKRRREEGESGLSRRDFLKTGAAVAGVGAAGLDLVAAPSMAAAAEVKATYHTTCPYCSASCGQLVDVDASGTSGNVLDVYGDHMSPFNAGGLCAKGAGAFQLVNNKRRVGAWSGTHPVNSAFAAVPEIGDGSGGPTDFTNGLAYRRVGNGAWSQVGLDYAMGDIATKLMSARGAVNPANGHNSKGVAFFGSSHLNNEQNYIYRKIIADFGSSNTEHQARI